MTRCRNAKRRTSKKKEYYRSHKTANRAKDIDQIQDELKKEKDTGAKIAFEIDDDLPGLGQHYCGPCARHFADNQTLLLHEASKIHKRRLKDVAQEQYTQAEAERAAGKTKEVLPPVHAKNKMDIL